MAKLTVEHAGRVYAACIGIEHFPSAPEWDLPGAASDALRFARWLTASGVPAVNVSLLASAVPSQVKRLRSEAAAAGIAWQEAVSRDQLMHHFTSTLEKLDGELLYVYWGGHGVLDQDERWLLFGPDASPSDPCCLDVHDLYTHMTRASLRGFGQQVFFIDACATFLEWHSMPNAPAIARFSTGPRRRVDRFAWHAVAPGQTAENNPAELTGVFSKALLDWLEHSGRGFRPNLVSLAAYLTECFTAGGAAAQTPTRHWIQHLDGSTDQIEPADIDEMAQRDVELTLYRLTKGDAARIDRYQNYVYRTGSQASLPQRTMPGFARFLLSRPRAMAALVEILAEEDRTAADSCLALARRLQIPGLLSAAEHGQLLQLLSRQPGLSLARLLEVLDQAFNFSVPPWTARIAEFDDSLERLVFCTRMLERHVGGLSFTDNASQLVPPLIKFTEHLAMLVEGDLRVETRAWGDRVACRLGVAAAGIEERRRDAENWAERQAGHRQRPRLVVQLFPETDDLATASRFTCTIWTGAGAETLKQHAASSSHPLSSGQVVRRIQRAAAELAAVDAEPLVVEVVLRQEHIQLPVDTWDGADPTDAVPMILSVERPVVLRCAPLANSVREGTRRTELKNRWLQRANGTVVSLRDADVVDSSAYGALLRDKTAARAAIHASQQHREKLIQIALYLGYPVILWARGPQMQLPDDQFAPLALHGDAEGLPERLRAHLAANCGSQTASRPALFWENPDHLLPESPLLTDPAAAAVERSEHR